MSELSTRLGILVELVKAKPEIGKTAVMKCLYLLQQVYKVPLGYSFKIHAYGPYDPKVMNDIDVASSTAILSVSKEVYPSGFVGYHLKLADDSNEILSEQESVSERYLDMIHKIVDIFGACTVKELELVTTIVYLYVLYTKNKWDMGGLLCNVQEIKPHFNLDEITRTYEQLQDDEILTMAAA
jgi:uncharacterized protein YwgA